MSNYRQRPMVRTRENPRLNELGDEILDPTNHIDQFEMRPATLQEQIARLSQAGQIYRERLQAQYDDLHEDDFGEEFDDVSEEGLSPYEIAELNQPYVEPDKSRFWKKKGSKATTPAPTSEPAPRAIQKAPGEGSGDA